ncbi:MAG: hypothetical protein IPH07_37015 [Deltaproteobacteria bacterium]|jgi:predicted small integral membrane protein|nr:hypothetical protein [Deltaproteobacteria bacterium]MBK8235797.1 hypothetical protein [Deltaproteobacteria bacterium]MBK8713426.1 hypothetical protein [Deltaproteobacteria bacterium]MBP7288051.1 hypothetical protein [Nannocystaceae bacterium]
MAWSWMRWALVFAVVCCALLLVPLVIVHRRIRAHGRDRVGSTRGGGALRAAS